MSKVAYRRKAILTRVHKALDAFYLLQKIDWEYDIRATLERIIGLALEEIEFEGGKAIERALVILQTDDGKNLEVKAGWKMEELDLAFSRTVVHQTIEQGEPILCENAKDDPRFMEAESLKKLNTLSLVSVPLCFEEKPVGAFYIESKSPGNIFEVDDLEFLREFAETISPYLKTALTHQDHVEAIRKLREEVSGRYSLGNIIGRSESIDSVFELIRIAADLDRTVLITGESGCGKELVAKAIHYNGHRRRGNFVVVDCSSLSEHLLESELFGHRKGAFTGASHDKVGAFQEANNGTLFLDEISDASKSLQQKLRRVLQEGEIRRVGETQVRKINVRIICATNKSLSELVRSGEFTRDLYYRINKFPIHIPPLRERKEDIVLLVEHFMRRSARAGAPPPRGIDSDAMELLVKLDWKENNIRELRNTVELAADFAGGATIDLATLERVLRIQRGESQVPLEVGRPRRGPADAAAGDQTSIVDIRREPFRKFLEECGSAKPATDKGNRLSCPFYRLSLEFSGRVIIEGLRGCRWKLRPAARLLGISPTKLRRELKEFLEDRLARSGGDIEQVSSALDIPIKVLRKKVADLGFEKAAAAGRQE
jgi:Nif-specific regulatory protein